MKGMKGNWQSPELYQTISWRRRTDGDPLLPIYKKSAEHLFRWEGDKFISMMLVLKLAPHLFFKVNQFFTE